MLPLQRAAVYSTHAFLQQKIRTNVFDFPTFYMKSLLNPVHLLELTQRSDKSVSRNSINFQNKTGVTECFNSFAASFECA